MPASVASGWALAIAALPGASAAKAGSMASVAAQKTKSLRVRVMIEPRVLLGAQRFAKRSRSASTTSGWTNSRTSPPRLAISRISVEETKL